MGVTLNIPVKLPLSMEILQPLQKLPQNDRNVLLLECTWLEQVGTTPT
jgi:hypothetical protein